jgi:hypothetical protein
VTFDQPHGLSRACSVREPIALLLPDITFSLVSTYAVLRSCRVGESQ